MTADEFEKAKPPSEVLKLLDQVEGKLTTDFQRTAYNFLIDYTECPEWFERTHEGGRLLLLCLEVLHAV